LIPSRAATASCVSFFASIAVIVCNVCDVDAAAVDDTYIFYLHGRIIEEEGVTPLHPTFGLYDYPAIVAALGSRGAEVVSEVRPSGTDVNDYARKTVMDIEKLIDGGVAPGQIVVVGFSKGGVISIYVSDILGLPEIRYVILAACGDWLTSYPELQLTGHTLSIFEESDTSAGTCRQFADRSKDLGSFRESMISTGKEHGAFYLPRSEWTVPTLDWIHNDD
jgi:hypothetical protein